MFSILLKKNNYQENIYYLKCILLIEYIDRKELDISDSKHTTDIENAIEAYSLLDNPDVLGIVLKKVEMCRLHHLHHVMH